MANKFGSLGKFTFFTLLLAAEAILGDLYAATSVSASQGTRGSDVKVKWTAVTPYSGARVDEINVFRDGTLVATLPVTATSWKDTSLSSGGVANAHEYHVSRWIVSWGGSATGPILGFATGWMAPQVRFKANGGNGTMPNQGLVGGWGQLNRNAFWRPGHVFLGWSKYLGDDNWVCYEDGEEIEIDQDIKLYAVWAPGQYQNGYTWLYNTFPDGSCRIYGVSPDPSGHLTIPETLAGHPVTRLGLGPCVEFYGSAFDVWNCTDFTLPSTLQFLDSGDFVQSRWWDSQRGPVVTSGEWAVGVKTASSTVTIPEGVKKVAVNFGYCAPSPERITRVVIPSGVKTLCSQAFYGLRNLAEVHIPASVKRVGECTFDDDAPGPFYFHGKKPTTVYDCAGEVVDEDDCWHEAYVFGCRENEDRVIYFRRGAEGWEDGGEWWGLRTYAWDPPPEWASGVSASNGGYQDRIRVSWNRTTGTTGYQIYRTPSWMPTGAAYCVATITDASLTTWDDYDVPEYGSGYSYTYYVAVGTDNLDGYDFGQISGGDSGWRAARTIMVKFKGNGGTVSSSTKNFAEGRSYGSFPSVSREGYKFLGWYTAAEGGERVLPTDIVTSNVAKLYAQWEIYWWYYSERFNAALDRIHMKDGSFAVYGGPDWNVDTAVSLEGGSSIKCTASNRGTVDICVYGLPDSSKGGGAGACLSFWWKTSSEENYDWLNCYVNGELFDQLSGETDWRQVIVPLSAFNGGTPLISFEYVKDCSVDFGQDCGWLDRFELTAPYELTFDCIDDRLQVVNGAPLGELPRPERVGYVFRCWRFPDGAKAKSTSLMPAKATRLVADWYEIGRPTFDEATVKVSEDAPYAELRVVRTGTRGAVRVRYSTFSGDSSDPAMAQADSEYYATNGELFWSDGDMDAKIVRVRLIPDLVEKWEVQKSFYVQLTPVDDPADLYDGESACVLGDIPVARVKLKEVSTKNVGTISLVLDHGIVTAGDYVCARLVRRGGTDGRVAVTLKTQNGTAYAGVDYQGFSDNYFWEDGSNEEFVIELPTYASGDRENKTFNFKVTALSGICMDYDMPTIAATKVYVTVASESPAPPERKRTFTVSGPGLFTAVPFLTEGVGAIKYRINSNPYVTVAAGATVNIVVPDGESVITFKVVEGRETASIAFEPQLRGLDYRFTALMSAGYVKVAPDGAVRDSKDRDLLLDTTVELCQSLPWSMTLDCLEDDDVLAVVGGSLPSGIVLVGNRLYGTPTKAKDYSAMFRVTSGTNRKRMLMVSFKAKPAGTALGTFDAVLSSDATQIGLTVSVTANGQVSAKTTGYSWSAAGVLSGYSEEDCTTRMPSLSAARGSAKLIVNEGDVMLYTEDGVVYQGRLRRQNGDLQEYRQAMALFAGYYTMALVSPSDEAGNGYLTFTIGEDGRVQFAGRLADNTVCSGNLFASLEGDWQSPESCTLILPVAYFEDGRSLMGDVSIVYRRNEIDGRSYAASVIDSGMPLLWSSPTLPSLTLTPVGGWYDSVFNLQRYYLGWNLAFDAWNAPFAEFELVGNQFGVNYENTTFSFVRETGIVTGKFDYDWSSRVKFYGIHLLNYDLWTTPLSCDVFATGYHRLPYTSETCPFTLRLTETWQSWQ